MRLVSVRVPPPPAGHDAEGQPEHEDEHQGGSGQDQGVDQGRFQQVGHRQAGLEGESRIEADDLGQVDQVLFPGRIVEPERLPELLKGLRTQPALAGDQPGRVPRQEPEQPEVEGGHHEQRDDRLRDTPGRVAPQPPPSPPNLPGGADQRRLLTRNRHARVRLSRATSRTGLPSGPSAKRFVMSWLPSTPFHRQTTVGRFDQASLTVRKVSVDQLVVMPLFTNGQPVRLSLR